MGGAAASGETVVLGVGLAADGIRGGGLRCSSIGSVCGRPTLVFCHHGAGPLSSCACTAVSKPC